MFVKIYPTLLKELEISLLDWSVVYSIFWYKVPGSNFSKISCKEIADMWQCDERTVRSVIQRMKKKGLLDKVKMPKKQVSEKFISLLEAQESVKKEGNTNTSNLSALGKQIFEKWNATMQFQIYNSQKAISILQNILIDLEYSDTQINEFFEYLFTHKTSTKITDIQYKMAALKADFENNNSHGNEQYKRNRRSF